MSKSILIMDTPKDCSCCDMLELTTKNNIDYYRCRKVHIGENGDFVLNVIGKETDDITERPDWCPLSPLPEKINLKQYVDNCAADMNSVVAYAYAQGYNDCLDEILEEKI